MSVLIEASTVLIRMAAIEAKVPGGLPTVVQAIRTKMACSDDDLLAVSMMAVDDLNLFTRHLEALGLVRSIDGVAEDFAVYDRFRGPWWPAPWISTNRPPADDGERSVPIFAHLTGREPGTRVVPAAWNYETSSYANPGERGSSPNEELEFRGRRDNVDVFWHKVLEKEVYVGRVYRDQPPDGQNAVRARALFDEAWRLMRRSGAAERVPPERLEGEATVWAQLAIAKFEESAALDPTRPEPVFWAGKCQQGLGLLAESLDSYGKAWMMSPSNADIAREAGISAMALGRVDVALYYAQEAVRLQPEGEGQQSNLALACLFAGNLPAARSAIQAALAQEPGHPTTLALQDLISVVSDGRMPCPARAEDIDWAAVSKAVSKAKKRKGWFWRW